MDLRSAVVTFLAWTCATTPTLGRPLLTVAYSGADNAGNSRWVVEVAPDPSLFGETSEGLGSTLAAQIGFSVSGSRFIDGTTNDNFWPYRLPGLNPFQEGAIDAGIVQTGEKDVFVSLGSNIFFTDSGIELVTLLTEGTTPTTITWGGQSFLEGTPFAYTGGRISQGDANFDEYVGMASNGPANGDFDRSGTLDAADIDLLFAAIRGATVDLTFDVDGSGTVDDADRAAWVIDVKRTWFGDANLNGEFNSSDLVAIFVAGKYETQDVASWAEGDWNGDAIFGSADLVAAFTDGGYEIGPRVLISDVDFDRNGTLDAADIDLLSAAIRAASKDLTFDVSGNGVVDDADRVAWVTHVKGTWFGDANLDGEFNSGDLVTTFVAGKYETRETSVWSDGDWNGDAIFGSADLVVAFTDGGYEKGPRSEGIIVPEPASWFLACDFAIVCIVSLARKRVGRPHPRLSLQNSH